MKLLLLSATSTTFLKAQFSTLLIKIFECKAIDTSEFLPIIDAKHICCSVACYKIRVKSYLAVINSVCCYCGLFVWPLSLAIVLKSDPIFIAALNNHIMNLVYLDYYDQKVDKYCFCFLCYHLMKQKKVSKFSSSNKVNVVICQDYPLVFETFILVKEILIAWCHLVIPILKL